MTSFVLVVVGLIVLGLLAWVDSLWEFSESAFKKKWPALSDDEFVLRCGPGTDRVKALKVRRIVATQLGLPYDHIYPEQNFVNDLGCN